MFLHAWRIVQKLISAAEALVVVVDAALEPPPFGSWSAVVHEEVWAVFVGGVAATAGPVVVWDDVAEWDIVPAHEDGGEFGGTFDGGAAVVAAVLAHFDANRGAVAGAVEVGLLALFGDGHVLDGDFVVGGEMPDEVADAVSAGAFWCAEGSAFEGEGVPFGICGVVLGAVDGDVAWGHGADDASAVGALLDHVHLQNT